MNKDLDEKKITAIPFDMSSGKALSKELLDQVSGGTEDTPSGYTCFAWGDPLYVIYVSAEENCGKAGKIYHCKRCDTYSNF